MASIETGNISTAQPNLHTQDLSTLNVATLTPLSPEVISRQATINIGTIGHVAHGKSTVVKAISGVQTVRFKNELERNITIKLERLMFGPDGKVIQPKSELQPDRMKSERANSEGAQTKRTQRVAIRRSLRQQLVPYQLNERRAARKCTLVPLLSPLPSLKPSSSSSSTSTSSSSSRSSPTSLKSSPTIVASKGTTYKREYVVERILAHDVRRNKQLFLVKWQGWSEDYNSWEPLEHLTNCDRLLEDFFADSLQQPVLDELQRWLDIRPASLSELNELLPSRGGVRALPPRSYVQRELMAIAATPVDKRNGALRDKCRHALFTYWTLVQRDKQLVSLRAWEQHMNKVALEDAELRVVNEVDLEGAPEGFVYVNNYIAGEGVFIPDDPPIGCECQRCDGRAQFCCWDQSQFGYRRRGRVNVPQGTPIYECNRRCLCKPETCTNRVVQRGRHIPLCIFRTRDGRGWGVRALRRVYSGEFVCEYVGEVVSFEEAERRGRGYDAQGRTYLFDLDFNSHDFPYTVDAATYGNVSHFINHSCEPNLGVWAVWVDCLDPNLPRLALFATRDIAKDEEITFDYMCNDVRTENASTPTSNRTRLAVATPDDDNENIRPQCKCGARTCRRYLF